MSNNVAGSHGILAAQGTIGTRSYGPPNDRFRSFAERYIIERAGQFTRGKELEEGWQVIQDAKKLYQMIAAAADDAEQALQAKENAQQAVETKKHLIQAQRHLRKSLAGAPPASSGIWDEDDRSISKRFYDAVIQNRKDKT